MKAATGLGKGVLIDDLYLAAVLVEDAVDRLDTCRPRASRDWSTGSVAAGGSRSYSTAV